jgi:hypothetical protein
VSDAPEVDERFGAIDPSDFEALERGEDDDETGLPAE